MILVPPILNIAFWLHRASQKKWLLLDLFMHAFNSFTWYLDHHCFMLHGKFLCCAFLISGSMCPGPKYKIKSHVMSPMFQYSFSPSELHFKVLMQPSL